MAMILIFLLPLLCGMLLPLCFRTEKAARRVVLILACLACAFLLYAASNPMPGFEGPGLLALMFVALALGALLVSVVIRFLPKPLPALRSPAIRMNLWLLGAFLLCPLACYAAIMLCATNFEGAAFSILVTAPLLYGFFGWLMPQQAHPRSSLTTAVLLLGWTVVPAALFYFSASSNSIYATIFSFLYLANREMAPILFPTLFYTPQSAFGLEVLRPLAISSTQVLLTGAFGVGMLIKHHKEGCA